MRFVYSLMLTCIFFTAAQYSQTTEGLPQQPVASKERSDLEDQRIKGRVRTIRYETESFSGTDAGKGRRLTRIEEFNEAGNKILINYIRGGAVASIMYYGYIDGARVNKSDGRSGGSGSGTVRGRPDAKPRDNRFEFKRLYEYSEGKLVKETLISNDGSKWMTYTHIYRDRETEVLVFDNKDKLNQKYRHTFDKDGNETGFEVFDAFKDPNKVTLKAKYTYGAFDATGNWTERTQSYASSKDGVETFSTYETVYRSITYYASYPAAWFAPINDPNKPEWEILPQEAKAGEVILSKRNELGILSNFAATPFELYGKRYASVEGFGQMMLYPGGRTTSGQKTNV